VQACSCSGRYGINQPHGAVSSLISPKFIELSRSRHWPHSSQMNPVHKVMLIFHYWNCTQKSLQILGPVERFLTYVRWSVISLRSTPTLDNHAFSAVCDCLLYIFAAVLHIWWLSPPSATSERAMPWWQWSTYMDKSSYSIQITF
jgi:hypothetical protein